jgi:hypothetical protein
MPMPSAVPRQTADAFESWFTPGRFTVILAVLICAAYPDVVFAKSTFYFRDYGFFSYPLAYYFRESFWHGQVPLWNPLSNCGIPFLAQWNTLVCYPLSVFYLVLPLTWALGAFTLLHWFWGGIGMYRLAHHWTGHRFAAVVAGVGFAFNGMTLNCLMWPNTTAALAWVPWVMLLTANAWRDGGRSVPAAGVVGALQMLTGAPEVILLTWLLLALLYALDARRLSVPPARSAGRFLLVVLIITGLAAVQLFPFIELLGCSNRQASLSNTEPVPLDGWANYLVPLFRCARSPAGIYYQPGQIWTTSYYVHLGLLALAILSSLRIRERRLRALAIFGALCVLLSFGDGIFFHRWLGKLFPAIYSMNYPVKYLVLVPFMASLLAASAVTHYLRVDNRKGAIRPGHLGIAAGILAVSVAGVLLWARESLRPYESWPVLVANGLSRILFLALALGALHLCRTLPNRSAGFRALVGMVLVAVLWLDVATHMPRQNPTVSYAAYKPGMQTLTVSNTPGAAVAGRILQSREARQQSDRITLTDPLMNYFGHRLSQSINCNLLDGNAMVDGGYPLFIKEHLQVLLRLYELNNIQSAPLTDFLSITHISSPTNPLEFTARQSFLPLVTIGQQPLFADKRTTLAALASPAFDPVKTVYLPPEAEGFVRATHADATIHPQRMTAHRIDIEASAPQAALLVVAQTFYHCWRAQINGRPVPIWRANHAFQAIELPAGHNRVSFQYVDRAFLLGLALSALTLFSVAVAWVRIGKQMNPRNTRNQQLIN